MQIKQKNVKLIVYKRKFSRNIRSHLIHVHCDTTLILHSDKLLDEMHIYIVVSLKSFLIRRPILHYIKSFNYTSSSHPSHWNFQWKCKYPQSSSIGITRFIVDAAAQIDAIHTNNWSWGFFSINQSICDVGQFRSLKSVPNSWNVVAVCCWSYKMLQKTFQCESNYVIFHHWMIEVKSNTLMYFTDNHTCHNIIMI